MYTVKMSSTRYFLILFAVLANVKCNIVKKTVYIDTTGSYYYQILPIDWFVKYKRIHFRVQALKDAHFAFLNKVTGNHPLFEVGLGTENNTISSIKKNQKIVTSVETPGILDPESFKGFWISWHITSKHLDLNSVFVVRIGNEGDDAPFLTTWDTYAGPPPNAHYFGVRTGPMSGNGFWEIDVIYDETNITGVIKEVVTPTILKREPDYKDFYRIYNQRIEFKVKILQDAWICLSNHPQRIEDSIQILLGGWGNTKCAIIIGYSSNVVVHHKCEGACDPDLYRGFWISLEEVENTLVIGVGNDGDMLPFMIHYADYSGKLPSYYSVGCTGNNRYGHWILKVAPPRLLKYIKTVPTKPVAYSSFDPIPKSGLIILKTKAIRDAWVGLFSSLSNDPEFEIIIGGWNNTRSTIRKNGKDLAVFNHNKLLETGTYYAGFWITIRQEESIFEGIVQELWLVIAVGQEDLGNVFLQYNHTMDKFKPIQLNLYSVGSTLNTEYVEWILEASVRRIDPVMPKYYVTHDNPNKYYLYALEGNRVEFELKTVHNAIVSLTTSSHKPNIELSIDNQTTKIFKDRSLMATYNTYFVLNNEIYQRFYIDWKYINKTGRELCLRFGYQGEDIALVEWRDPQPFLIKYIGVETRKGIGYWKFNDAWLESDSSMFMPNFIRTYNNPEKYQFFPVIKSPIRFKVKASRDANLAFTSFGERNKPILEVLLGAFGNNWQSQYTYIRRDFQKSSPGEVFIRTPNILSDDKFVSFWINWEYIEDYSSGLEPKMKMELGLEGEEALLSWEGKDLFPINYVGITTYRASAVWIFEDDVKIIERKKWMEVATKGAEGYKFFPVLTKPLWLQVKASSDAYIALTSSRSEEIFPILECMIGAQNSTKTIMLLNRNETMGKHEVDTIGIIRDSYYESFWLDWNNFTDTLGKDKMTVYIGRRSDHSHFASLIIDPFDINFFGISSKRNTAFWHFEEFPGILPSFITTFKHISQYQFYIAPNHALKFHVKAESDAYIALSSTNSSSDVMYEIMIGAESNHKSFIRKNKTIPISSEEQQMPCVETDNILRNNLLRGFWVDWVYKKPPWLQKPVLRIRLGHQGEVQPFLRWYDSNPLPIKYIGFTGGNDNTLWKFEEVTEDIVPGDYVPDVSLETKEYDFTPTNYTQVTTNNFTYRFFSLPGQKISFKVKTQSDAYIVISSRPQITSLFPFYEILLGGRNRKSWIRRENNYPKTIVNTPLVLKVSEFRGFWVSWVDGNIEVGFLNRKEAFVRLNDPDPFKVNFIGITSRFAAVWQITDTTMELNVKYQFFPIAADNIVFLLKGPENARIILTNHSKALDPIIEVILGSKKNTEISFKGEGFFYNKNVGTVLENNRFRGYWFSWASGMFAVGLNGDSNPLAHYSVPRSVYPNYIGFAGYTGTKITWQFKVTPVWKPVQWENQNDDPCFLDPEGLECKDRKKN